jgi:hypothetical protein
MGVEGITGMVIKDELYTGSQAGVGQGKGRRRDLGSKAAAHRRGSSELARLSDQWRLG